MLQGPLTCLLKAKSPSMMDWHTAEQLLPEQQRHFQQMPPGARVPMHFPAINIWEGNHSMEEYHT